MSTQARPPLEHLSRPMHLKNVLQVCPGRVESRTVTHDSRCIVVPPADEKAWEGTEIDVRRTVL